jgi:hypothetical protein
MVTVGMGFILPTMISCLPKPFGVNRISLPKILIHMGPCFLPQFLAWTRQRAQLVLANRSSTLATYRQATLPIQHAVRTAALYFQYAFYLYQKVRQHAGSNAAFLTNIRDFCSIKTSTEDLCISEVLSHTLPCLLGARIPPPQGVHGRPLRRYEMP